MSHMYKRSPSTNVFNYEVKLLGILPIRYKWKENMEGGPWDTKNLKLCKKPSASSHRGQLLMKADHPSLLNSGIIEKKIGMSELMSVQSDSSSDSEPEEDEEEPEGDQMDDLKQEKMAQNDDSDAPVIANVEKKYKISDNKETADEKLMEKAKEIIAEEKSEGDKILSSIHPATKFLQTRFGSTTSTKVPDFVSERLIPIFLGTAGTDTFLLGARRINFSPKNFKPFQTIQVSIMIPEKDFHACTYTRGPTFAKWATDDHGDGREQEVDLNGVEPCRNLKSPETNCNADKDDDDDDDYDSDDEVCPYHHAYLQADFTKKGIGNRGAADQSFNLMMAGVVDGVWKFEEDPKNYTCAHLAEMRAAQETTVAPFCRNGRPNSFYERVRMQRNYWQAHLAGETQYMVGVNGLIREKGGVGNSSVIKELRLYDVQEIPQAIQISAQQEGFEPWTTEQLHQKLFDGLKLIHDTVTRATVEGVDDPVNGFIFIKFVDTDNVVFDPDGSLLNHYKEEGRKVLLTGIPSPPPEMVDENELKKFDKMLLNKILSCTGYYKGAPLPTRCRRSQEEGVERHFTKKNFNTTSSHLELTFPWTSLADDFVDLVKKYWRRKENIPNGFERLWIQKKEIRLPDGHPLKKPWRRHDEFPSQVPFFHQRQGNGFHDNGHKNFDTRDTRRQPNVGGGWRGDSRPNDTSTTYRSPHARGHQRSTRASDLDENWRR